MFLSYRKVGKIEASVRFPSTKDIYAQIWEAIGHCCGPMFAFFKRSAEITYYVEKGLPQKT